LGGRLIKTRPIHGASRGPHKRWGRLGMQNTSGIKMKWADLLILLKWGRRKPSKPTGEREKEVPAKGMLIGVKGVTPKGGGPMKNPEERNSCSTKDIALKRLTRAPGTTKRCGWGEVMKGNGKAPSGGEQ